MNQYSPMKYPDMQERIIAYADRPEGYNGDTVDVGLVLLADYPGNVYAVYKRGYYLSHLTAATLDDLEKAVEQDTLYYNFRRAETTLWQYIERLKEDGHINY